MHSIRKVFASTARLRVPLTAARQPMTAAILRPQQLSRPPVAPLRQLSSSGVRQSAEHVWSLGRLNHVAIAVPDLEAATETYKTMGATVSEPQALPEHGVTVVFIELPNTKLELLHPLGENSPIAGFLAKNKMGGMHHICIEVEDINVAVADLKARGVRCLSPEPRIGAHGKPVMFLHPKDCNGVLLELEQV